MLANRRSRSPFSVPDSQFKKLNLNVKNYILYLESENAKLQKRIVKLEVSNFSGLNKIKAMQKEVTRLRPKVILRLPKNPRDKP